MTIHRLHDLYIRYEDIKISYKDSLIEKYNPIIVMFIGMVLFFPVYNSEVSTSQLIHGLIEVILTIYHNPNKR
jgi:hypothetical protein